MPADKKVTACLLLDKTVTLNNSMNIVKVQLPSVSWPIRRLFCWERTSA